MFNEFDLNYWSEMYEYCDVSSYHAYVTRVLLALLTPVSNILTNQSIILKLVQV